jgi:hypothetical protein
MNGTRVTYGTRGSVRPDNFSATADAGNPVSVEVKNYTVTNAAGRRRLIREAGDQAAHRVSHLPAGTRQTIIVDARGQGALTTAQETQIKVGISNRSGGAVKASDVTIIR